MGQDAKDRASCCYPAPGAQSGDGVVAPSAPPQDWANPRPVDVTEAELCRGGGPDTLARLMPPEAQIPATYDYRLRTWAHQVFQSIFYYGKCDVHLVPKDGIDGGKALRHIAVIMGSWAPKHEHKIAACAYLFASWFEDPGT